MLKTMRNYFGARLVEIDDDTQKDLLKITSEDISKKFKCEMECRLEEKEEEGHLSSLRISSQCNEKFNISSREPFHPTSPFPRGVMTKSTDDDDDDEGRKRGKPIMNVLL
jgi:hypothetical protein